jgi:hypothetical protein
MVVVIEPRFVILKHIGNAPSMAMCTRCHIKFFTPLELLGETIQAEENLRDKFVRHTCVRNMSSLSITKEEGGKT